MAAVVLFRNSVGIMANAMNRLRLVFAKRQCWPEVTFESMILNTRMFSHWYMIFSATLTIHGSTKCDTNILQSSGEISPTSTSSARCASQLFTCGQHHRCCLHKAFQRRSPLLHPHLSRRNKQGDQPTTLLL